ncbi:hypothetical protein PAXINDRAFT_170677 [Paxillus involutus ATCC 200175]|uniref:Uncharacterized protein n=1 Tax=Paxillus involutus ATCC 200175 TaxID=664439 RepID=A0A0C9SVB2_PAXIN|nr:hypothetical protein PAXINDRAFT_170677 [Paxillus involutus ATCC 200175]
MRKYLLDDSLNGDQSTSAPLDTDSEHVQVPCYGLFSRRRARSGTASVLAAMELSGSNPPVLRGVTSSHSTA